MEKNRPTRNIAGINRSLSADFVWPDNFGYGTRTSRPDRNTIKAGSTHDIESRKSQASSMKSSPVEENCKSTKSKGQSSGSKHSSVDLQRKKLILDNEKKRQELENEQRKVQFELENKQKELQNSLRLLDMEEELQQAELENQLTKDTSISSKHTNIPETDEFVEKTNDNFIANWINDLPEVTETGEDEKCSRENRNSNNEIKMLCDTLKDVLISVKGPSPTTSRNLSARQVLDKDFPCFDGNPQDWPLFYKHFMNICELCEYSDEEIMLKLQKCLKGPAKSTVSGMMLTSNVGLVMKTLQTRFGRPEFIIETLISKIRNLPFIRDCHLEKLIIFSNEVNNMVSTMKILKSKEHFQNPQLLKDLLNKLPEILKLNWGEVVARKSGIVNLDDSAKWLESYANAASFVSTPRPFEAEKQTHFKKPERVLSTVEEETAQTFRKHVCSYCGKDSHKNACPRMKDDDINTRWKTVTEKKLCFSCLKRNHHKFKCRYRKNCGIMGCKLFHHPLLHKEKPESTIVEGANVTNVSSSEPQEPQVEMLCAVASDRKILLRMISIKLHGPKATRTIYALCDEASTITLLDAEIAKHLGFEGSPEQLCLQWTNDEITSQVNSLRFDMKISKVDEESKTHFLRGVRTIENLSLPSQTVKMSDIQKYWHLRGIPVQNYENQKAVMIIGQDNIHLITPRQIRCGPENSLMATRCLLGWSVHGPMLRQAEIGNENYHVLHVCEKNGQDDDLHNMMKTQFTTESFGVLLTPNRMSQDDLKAMQSMKDTIQRVDGCYEIGLLWSQEDVQLPDSKYRAIQRLKCVEKKCRRNDKLGKEYCIKIRSYLEKGYARKLTEIEAGVEGPRTWYLPHFPVENPNKPNKIRLVFDAAAKSNGLSLNDVLLPGPDLLQSLVVILWKFRQRKFGFCGDVREMFHQVRIREQDIPSQRFLWRDLDYNRDPDTYEMRVMIFGATCSPVCAQFVKNYNAEKFAQDPKIQKAIIEKFYVDDYLDSTDTEEDAINTISEVRRIQKLAGFDVVNWMSNSTRVQEIMKEDMLLATSKNIDENPLHRVLGLWWNVQEDNFSFRLNNIEKLEVETPTKRKVLRSVMSLFDPLGFVACFTIKGKILMQDIWRSGVDWDAELPENLKNSYLMWLESLPKITNLRIPRCYSLKISTAERIEIHTFSDSSEKAFAAVSYLRVIRKSEIEVSFITARTRVSPLKPLSIPRLELQGAVMASRLAESIKNELELTIDQMYFWTDSRCVLGWIRSDGRKYKQFVAHRIGEIQERTRCEDWRWVPSEVNPADEATRDGNICHENKILHIGFKEMAISKNWFNGPEFLKSTEACWPKEKSNTYSSDLEIKKEFQSCEVCLLVKTNENVLPDIKKFSKWLKLIRTTGWCLRYIKNLKTKNEGDRLKGELKVEELKEAESIWIKQSQYECFGEEIRHIEKGKGLRRESKLASLSPEMKNGFLVLGGRTNLSSILDEYTKQPIILSPKHSYTKLLIRHFHELFRHRGIETTLNGLRQKFWIINGRAAVKSVFSQCNKCKIERSKPRPPIMGQLPEMRLRQEVRPFVNTGMDFFGPFMVKIGRRHEKRWGVLFTCLAVRAIHLEISHTLNTDSAIMAIMRMSARRGKPNTIHCDNGTNFRGASKELRNLIQNLDTSSIENCMSSRNIEFRFIPPASAHMGGAWERLIGSVKRVIGNVLHQQPLKEEVLRTLFAEAELLVNSRPLTRLSNDPSDLEALTPNHFLLGSSNGEGPPFSEIPDQDCLRRGWRMSRKLLDSFWLRWVKEYLPTLTRRNKWIRDQKPIRLGDVVVLVDDTAPRYRWKLGRIVNVYPGPDQKIRVVDIKTSTGEYRRPVTKICLLELEEN